MLNRKEFTNLIILLSLINALRAQILDMNEEANSVGDESNTYCTEINPNMLTCILELRHTNPVDLNENTFKNVLSSLPYPVEELYTTTKNVRIIEAGTFDSLQGLRHIRFSNNYIELIKTGVFNNLNNLNILDLSNNNISTIEEDSFLGTHSLLELYLNDNQILNMSFLYGCEKLKILNLTNNRIKEIEFPNEPLSLEFLYIAYNDIKVLPSDVFANTNLSLLNLSNNKLSKIDSNSLRHLGNLNKLDLSGNPLFEYVTIPVDIFRYIPKLSVLNISNTRMHDILLGTFSPLNKLEVLDLSMNSLENLPNGIFENISLLRKLYLNGNHLSSIWYTDNPNLQEVNLNNNLWNCGALVALTRMFSDMRLVPGNDYHTTNIYGIGCLGASDFISIQEERAAVTSIQNDVKEIIRELKTIRDKLNLPK